MASELVALTHGEIDFERQEKDQTFPCEHLRSDAPAKSYKVRNCLGVGEKLHLLM